MRVKRFKWTQTFNFTPLELRIWASVSRKQTLNSCPRIYISQRTSTTDRTGHGRTDLGINSMFSQAMSFRYLMRMTARHIRMYGENSLIIFYKISNIFHILFSRIFIYLIKFFNHYNWHHHHWVWVRFDLICAAWGGDWGWGFTQGFIRFGWMGGKECADRVRGWKCKSGKYGEAYWI